MYLLAFFRRGLAHAGHDSISYYCSLEMNLELLASDLKHLAPTLKKSFRQHAAYMTLYINPLAKMKISS